MYKYVNNAITVKKKLFYYLNAALKVMLAHK